MQRIDSLLFESYKLTDVEIEEVQTKLSDPLVKAYIQTLISKNTHLTLATMHSNDLAKLAVDAAFLNGMLEIGSKLIFDTLTDPKEG